MTGVEPGPGSEFELIRRLVERWGSAARGIGDDAAVIRPNRGESLVLSVDAAVEGRHFRSDWLSPREIGYRAVAAALSDLAAMAAEPVGILVAFGLTPAWVDRLMEIADGIGDAVKSTGTTILGGNLTSAGELSITTTVAGSAFAPLARSGARAGDRVYVTGRLGGPGAALRLLRAGQSPGSHRERFARPVPRIREARWLAANGATAAIDISDGLVADSRHLAAASGVSLTILGDRVPVFDGVGLVDALRGGEEYELVVTATSVLDTIEFKRRFGVDLTEIGAVEPPSQSGVTVRGVEVAALAGYDHFSG